MIRLGKLADSVAAQSEVFIVVLATLSPLLLPNLRRLRVSRFGGREGQRLAVDRAYYILHEDAETHAHRKWKEVERLVPLLVAGRICLPFSVLKFYVAVLILALLCRGFFSGRPTTATISARKYGSRDDKHQAVSGFNRKLFRSRLVEGRVAVRVPAYEPSILVSEGPENRDAHTAPALHPFVYLGSREKHGQHGEI
ncbi:hypothetical protein FB451DRAFT_1369673 [Mycena latifolia]|nr:hypothetical protein FB451DRAFT_1369673 [Mycena latifolia]